jgi:H+-transporting ATPase
MPDGLTTQQAQELLRRYGPNAIPLEKRSALRELAMRLWGPVPWLLETTLVLTLLTRRYADSIAIGFLLSFNAVVATFQEGKARSAVDLLRARVVVRARVMRDGSWSIISSEQLVPGDAIHLGTGDIVPADVTLSDGSIAVDQSVLTGESALRTASGGDEAYSGTTVVRGNATAVVSATGRSTKFGKTAELVRIAKSPGQLERLVLRLVSVLTAVSLGVIALIAAFAVRFGYGVTDIAVFAIMILLASVPIALPAAFTLATTLGSLALAKRGALITRLSALEDAASMDVLCTDKTGTITKNRISVDEVVAFAPFTKEQLLTLAAAASDDAGQDPIDLGILRVAASEHLPTLSRSAFTPFEPATKRSSAGIVWNGRNAIVEKGAPAVLRSLVQAPLPSFDSELERLASGGARVIAVTLSSDDAAELVGLVALADPPRDDAADLVSHLHELGIDVSLLTGDLQATALHVAGEVGIPASAVYASIFPKDKLEIVRRLQRAGHVVGMTGDGVNDAPALKQATIGIAVSNATDVAKAAAGVVLTAPGLGNVVSAIESSRAVFERMVTYTMMKLIKYFEIIGILTIGFFTTHAFLLTPELLVALLVFNDFVTLAISTDNVSASKRRDVWEVRRLLVPALLVAVLTTCFVLGTLFYALTSWHLDVEHLRSAVFLALVVMGQFSVFVIRSRRSLVGMAPSKQLVLSSSFAVLAVSTMVAVGLLTPALPLGLVAEIVGLLLLGAGVLALAKTPFIFRSVAGS